MKGPAGRMLLDLAEACGIKTSYFDCSGKRQHARPEVLQALLRCWGIQARNENEIYESLRSLRIHQWNQLVEPVHSGWEGQTFKLPLRFRRGDEKPLTIRVCFEQGETFEWKGDPRQLALIQETLVDGIHWRSREWLLPRPLPGGYHQVQIQTSRSSWNSVLIGAPEKSYSKPGPNRDWGVFLPMYAAHTKSSWGAGDFNDWEQLVKWTSSLGGTVAGTLPLTAAFLNQPFEPSPYSPASRLFWNEFYLHVPSLPEMKENPTAARLVASASFQEQIAALREKRLVDYRGRMRLVRKVLQSLAVRFFEGGGESDPHYQNWIQTNPMAGEYAAFRAYGEFQKSSWHTWPERQKQGALKEGDCQENSVRYHLYVQYRAAQQISILSSHCARHGVDFYLDLPLGVNPDSFDVWKQREVFALDASAGAPPDSFFTKGQGWGFPPMHPGMLRKTGYRYLIDLLRFQMRHTGLLRIDHVMGLHRLYWIPHGFYPKDGAYVSYPARELHAILNLESHRHRCRLAGENLGTVPPEVTKGMEQHRIRSMYVVQYSQSENPQEALPPPPELTVASLNTHDMPTFASHWKGLDILDRHQLGLITRDEVKELKKSRARLRKALVSFLRENGLLSGKAGYPQVLQATLNFLARSPAEIVLVNLEDLWGEVQPQNVPGTSTERPNWRLKTKFIQEQYAKQESLRRVLAELNKCREISRKKARTKSYAKVHLHSRSLLSAATGKPVARNSRAAGLRRALS